MFLFLVHMKANFLFSFLFDRLFKLLDGLKDVFKLLVVFLFEALYLCLKVFMVEDEFSEFGERPDNLDIHVDGFFCCLKY